MISIVIPVYQSENTLKPLYERLITVLNFIQCKFEIIFIEDGGKDGAWEIIEFLCSIDDRVRGIKMNRNYGQHNCLLCGIRSALGEIIITLDDDLQHPPEEIPRLIGKFNEGFDVVYGAPHQQQHGILRNLASKITKIALKEAMGASNVEKVSAFRIIKTNLRSAFNNYRDPLVNIDVLLTWATSSFSSIEVKHEPRAFGKSNYTLRKLISHAVNMITGFSTGPLQLASILGFLCAIFGLITFAYVFISWWIYGSSVPGFAFMACIISIFSGVQLITLGIIGEYLARVHFRTMDRPSYVVVADTYQDFDREKN